jgi:hypothetical protein
MVVVVYVLCMLSSCDLCKDLLQRRVMYRHVSIDTLVNPSEMFVCIQFAFEVRLQP